VRYAPKAEAKLDPLMDNPDDNLSPPPVASVARRSVKYLILFVGGEGGIRTPDTVARMPHFECGAFDHSATSPN
jgi:hypothetical protein